MISNISSTKPTIHPDETISATLLATRDLPSGGTLLRMWLPISVETDGSFGRYFLARCTEDTTMARASDWSIYARRALFNASVPTANEAMDGSIWELWVPGDEDVGHRWLRQRRVHTTINLIGPLGRSFALTPQTRALLVLTDTDYLPTTLPLIHTFLDQGGRVTLIVQGNADSAAAWRPHIPIPVETHFATADSWPDLLEDPVRWADQVCAALPPHAYASLAEALRRFRFRLDADFAQVLVTRDLICGIGACLACVVPTREGGYTRSCINGPVFALTTLA